jgi:hypothetical protein
MAMIMESTGFTWHGYSAGTRLQGWPAKPGRAAAARRRRAGGSDSVTTSSTGKPQVLPPPLPAQGRPGPGGRVRGYGSRPARRRQRLAPPGRIPESTIARAVTA